MSPSEIAAVAQAAGFPPASIPIAVAIALAESGGNPTAHNPVGADDSYGLWQINMLGALGPDRRRRLGLSSNAQLWDPATNARAAFMISAGGKNWNPWTTYTHGLYKKHLTGAIVPTNVESSNPNVILNLPDLPKALGIENSLVFWLGVIVVGYVLLDR